MGTVKTKLYFLVVNFWTKTVTMATYHLTRGRYIPHFGLNALNDIV